MTRDTITTHLRCASGGGGGADRVIFNTVPGLNAGRFGQAVLYLAKRGAEISGLVEPLRQRGLLCEVVPGQRIFDLRQFLAVRRFVLDHKIRLLHCHDAKADLYGFLLRLLHPSLRIISTLHGWTEKTRRGRFYSRLDKAILRRFDAVVAVSEYTATIARSYGIRRTVVVPNGIDPEAWRPTASRDAHPNDPPFTVAFVGRISAEKGPLEFVETARAASRKEPGIRFVVLGEGPDLPAMRAAVASAGLSLNFDFRGYQPPTELKTAYRTMDVLALPSRREGLPMALLEACAMGVCVAAFSVGGIPEVIVHGQNGLLAKPGDTGDLAAQILTLRQDAPLAARLRKNARTTVENHFSVQAQVRQLETIYADTLKPGHLKGPNQVKPPR
jgi:glycosyltransferase involved in cell wall biosynthesis